MKLGKINLVLWNSVNFQIWLITQIWLCVSGKFYTFEDLGLHFTYLRIITYQR
jgi:hypothetical protein